MAEQQRFKSFFYSFNPGFVHLKHRSTDANVHYTDIYEYTDDNITYFDERQQNYEICLQKQIK